MPLIIVKLWPGKSEKQQQLNRSDDPATVSEESNGPHL